MATQHRVWRAACKQTLARGLDVTLRGGWPWAGACPLLAAWPRASRCFSRALSFTPVKEGDPVYSSGPPPACSQRALKTHIPGRHPWVSDSEGLKRAQELEILTGAWGVLVLQGWGPSFENN